MSEDLDIQTLRSLFNWWRIIISLILICALGMAYILLTYPGQNSGHNVGLYALLSAVISNLIAALVVYIALFLFLQGWRQRESTKSSTDTINSSAATTSTALTNQVVVDVKDSYIPDEVGQILFQTLTKLIEGSPRDTLNHDLAYLNKRHIITQTQYNNLMTKLQNRR